MTACPDCAPRLGGVLRVLATPRGLTAAEWLWGPASGADGHLVIGPGTVTVHTDRSESGVVVRADPGALPVPSRSMAAVVVLPVLPQLPVLDGVFAELRRVLRPSGLVTMAVPDGPPLGLRGRRLRADVRTHWRHRSAVDHPDWLLTTADFAVLGDDRLEFRDPAVASRIDALSDAGLLPPALPEDLRARLATHPSMRDGRVSLRRLVARR